VDWFEIIKTAHRLHDFNIVTVFLPSVAAKCINLLRAWYFRDLYEDAKLPGRMFVDIRLKVPVLFFSRPRSEGWPHHERTFSIYPCPLSF